MTAETQRTEVAIVGAGVIGLACAFELSRRGRSVTVIEREEAGFGASTVAAGMLTPSFEVELTPPPLVALQLDSLRRYPQFVADIEAASGLTCGYREEGTLWVSRHRDDELELDHLCRIQEDRGLPAQRLTGRQVRQMEPHVSPRAIGGMLVETDHQINSRRLLTTLRAACEAVGVEVIEHTAVERVARSDGRITLRLRTPESQQVMHAEQLLLAAGVWLEDDLITPLPSIGMRPIKGQIVHLNGQPLVDHVLRNSDVYIVPRDGGELLVGATEEEQGFNMQPTAGGTLDLLRYAFEILPGIYDLYVSEIDVGLRPAVMDHQPVLGATDVEGVFIATGHYRGGVLLAPSTAHWIAETMLNGDTPAQIASFGIERLIGSQAVEEDTSD